MGNRRAPAVLFPVPVVRVGGRGPHFRFPSCNSAHLAFLLVLLRPSESFLSGTWSGEAGQPWRVSWAPLEVPFACVWAPGAFMSLEVEGTSRPSSRGSSACLLWTLDSLL